MYDTGFNPIPAYKSIVITVTYQNLKSANVFQ